MLPPLKTVLAGFTTILLIMLFLLGVGFFVAGIITIFSGCTSFAQQKYTPETVYNYEEEQDRDCLNSYGGEAGYCGKVYKREVK